MEEELVEKGLRARRARSALFFRSGHLTRRRGRGFCCSWMTIRPWLLVGSRPKRDLAMLENRIQRERKILCWGRWRTHKWCNEARLLLIFIFEYDCCDIPCYNHALFKLDRTGDRALPKCVNWVFIPWLYRVLLIIISWFWTHELYKFSFINFCWSHSIES